uniref:Zgc:195001 n=1 Tax=Scleropages formosus TaxID=113540 RepID=A0A8C9RLA6_SCLFO
FDNQQVRRPAGTREGHRRGRRGRAEASYPTYEPNVPEPQSREELLKYWLPLSLDDRTAQKLLWISEGTRKVSRMSEDVCPYLDRPERYDHSPQVLCKENLWGSRGYWEVEYTGWVVIGIVCEGAPRRAQDGACGIGENDRSWGLGWAGSCYQAWHNGENVDIEAKACSVIGVYADQPAGILSFYAVEGQGDSKAVKLLHRYKTSFKEPLQPAFWVGSKSFCWIQSKAE